MKGMKTGGRQKGSRNKVVGEGRKYLAEFLEKYFAEGFEIPGVEEGRISFEEDITSPQLTIKDRLVIIKDVMQYVYPKMQAVDMEATVDTADPFTERLLELSDSMDQNPSD